MISQGRTPTPMISENWSCICVVDCSGRRHYVPGQAGRVPRTDAGISNGTMHVQLSRSARKCGLLLLGCVLTGAIFVTDAFIPLGLAVAVLYVVVVVMAGRLWSRRGIQGVTAVCILLTVLAYLIEHGLSLGPPLARASVALAAIGVTAALTLRSRADAESLLAQARLLDLTHDPIFVCDMSGFITYWNHGAEELYGWSVAEALGRPAAALLQARFPAALSTLKAELLQRDRWEGEVVHVRRDGAEVIVVSRWSLQRDARGEPVAILSTNNDITERHRAAELLRRTQTQLLDAQRIARMGSVTVDLTGGAITWSAEAVRILGFRPGERQDVAAALERVHPGDRARLRRCLVRVIRGEVWLDFVGRLVLLDGGLRHVHVFGHRLDDGDRAEVVGAIQDITDETEAQESLQQAQAALAHVTRVATLGELTASIAHEVNQPLAAIVTNGEAGLRWLDRAIPDIDEVRAALRRVVSDGKRAGAVVQRVRALVRKAPPQLAGIGIEEVVNDVVALMQREMAAQRVMLRLELASDLPRIRGDRIQLQQVMINLIVNGIQAMQAITDRPRNMVLRSALVGSDKVVVSVEDSGTGIDESIAARLFDAFFTTRAEGLGIGLSICRSIVEAHGGNLTVSRNAEHGATFHVMLPAAEVTT